MFFAFFYLLLLVKAFWATHTHTHTHVCIYTIKTVFFSVTPLKPLPSFTPLNFFFQNNNFLGKKLCLYWKQRIESYALKKDFF